MQLSIEQYRLFIQHLLHTGFFFQGSEIYGGLSHTWDYGPLGVELKQKMKQLWWKTFVYSRQDMIGLDTSIFLHSSVWEASGHVGLFQDTFVECKQCHMRFEPKDLLSSVPELSLESVDKVEDTFLAHKKSISCPHCEKSDWTDPKDFQMMFSVSTGAENKPIYLRPETAQGIFIQFKNILQSSRRQIPFGVAQIGKSFRNEITAGNFIFRTREFEQMEIEYFLDPEEDFLSIFQEFQDSILDFLHQDLGFQKENIFLLNKEAKDLAHYSSKTVDFEYAFPFGRGEIIGMAFRSDFDLKLHSKHSGVDLQYWDEKNQRRYFPHVIEPSFGVDRLILAFLTEHYHEEILEDGSLRKYMTFPYELAPYQIAIFPLKKNHPELLALTHQIQKEYLKGISHIYDDKGSIGKLYRRQDEIGTPFCITVDFQSLEDQTVTIRERDTMTQIRLPLSSLKDFLREPQKIFFSWQK